MEHINDDTLQAYIGDILSEVDRERIEEHLATCDRCLDNYFDVVDQWSLEAPSLSEDFTDQTFDQILKKQVMPTSERVSSPSSRKKSTLLHYSIAAGLTLFLMFSGVFQQMMQVFDEDSLRQQPSISDQIVKQTSKWLDQGIKLKGEDTNE
ncbi:zf-HC2 domain-containing protein [Pontibacillus marinus]|uniref:Anti-sigma-W factor RsiW n=1 Tax=Pontibacillus marinus BH030004 = DSM 16465 TaxID=1385511 RepID=A0A0A5I3B3_9BACI|nr:zf-HC2 domain-containing protein [Pontibacillus marinus]KGX90327.1 hypothetical protein N783_21285 [Pontibacillus marinus BH030004 = DSM 16465]